MNVPLRKGWCPGALRPMAAKDGLLVRLRITGGILPAARAHALADLAMRYGNGLFDLSARGNLQMRGATDASLPGLQDGLAALGLLDTDHDAEAVRNVVTSPLAGLHEGLDIRPLTIELERRLATDRTLHALPTKFGFLIDDGSTPSLAGIDADVRFDWIADGARFSTAVAGTRASATRIGTCTPPEIAERAAQIAHGALSLFAAYPETRRMRDLVAIAGAGVVAAVSGDHTDMTLPSVAEGRVQDIVGLRTFAPPSRCLGLAAPFGRLEATMIHAAADLAARTPQGELRLTPFRVILVPGVTGPHEVPGFITDPGDPRLAIATCVGAAGCTRGTTDTHRDAGVLAGTLGHADGIALHVSGCEKGCAKPSRTALTLVARDGRYDLVRDGRPGDTPLRRGLDLAAARDAVRSVA